MTDTRMLLLVDGYGMVYRAFYAIPGMQNREGTPTNAVFGCVRMLQHLREHWGATHWAVVFDGGLPDERMDLVAEYKANRERMPDDLSVQLPLIDAYLDAAGIRQVCVEGQEADDVLAALAVRAKEHVDEVLIATSDKDLLQAVDEVINVVPLSGKGPKLGPSGVCEKTGVRPEQIVPWLAMIGDSSDNISGVPGVGKKTAARLLQTYGTLAGIRDNLGALAGSKVGQALAANWDRVERNVRMVQLNLDIAGGEDIADWRVGDGQVAALLALFEELGFERFAKDLREPDLFG